jgi:hypothetical protein
MSKLRLSIATLALAALSACSRDGDLTDPRVIRDDLRGTWTEPFGVPGARFQFSITVADTTISGSGIFAIEAGASGTSTVSGAIDGQQVHLDFMDSIGRKQHFVGTLTAPDAMSGSFWEEHVGLGSDPIVVTFRRTSR